jgi:hypothetical protein
VIGDLLTVRYDGNYAAVYDVRRGTWGSEIVDLLLVIGSDERDLGYVYVLHGERILIVNTDDMKVVSR